VNFVQLLRIKSGILSQPKVMRKKAGSVLGSYLSETSKLSKFKMTPFTLTPKAGKGGS
jgi:hypothetical protein